MKVIIITPYWLKTKGGITTVVDSLSKSLRKIKNTVYVVTPDDGADSVKLSKNKFIFTVSVIKYFIKINPDVLHIHSSGFLLLAPIIYKFFINKKVKIIFTFHTQPRTFSFFTGKLLKERGLFEGLIFNYLLKYCDTTTYVSRSLMASLEKIGVRIINPVIIHNGVTFKEFSVGDTTIFKQKYNLSNRYPILCMVSVFTWDWKVKGIEILILSLKKILNFQPKAKLLVVGDGQYMKHLKGYVKKEGLKDSVIFTGNMDNPFIALSVCDIYCHISLNEALPIAPLEAMFFGKPVIVSRDGGLPEIVTDGIDGILTNSNPDNVADAILSLIEKPDFMKELSKNAINTAKIKFSWEEISKKYMKLYQK